MSISLTQPDSWTQEILFKDIWAFHIYLTRTIWKGFFFKYLSYYPL